MDHWETWKMSTTWQLICLDKDHFVNPLDIIAVVPNGSLPKDKYCLIVSKHRNIEVRMSAEEVMTAIDKWIEGKKDEQSK